MNGKKISRLNPHLVCWLIAITVAPHLFSSTTNNTVKKQVKKVIEKALFEDGRTLNDIPDKLSYEFDLTIDGAANKINDFLSAMKRIVLKSEVNSYVDKAIRKHLKKEHILISSLPYQASNKVYKKREEIIEQVENLMWYNDYVEKSEIKNIVKSEIDYFFIRELNQPVGGSNTVYTDSSWDWSDTISTIANNAIDLISIGTTNLVDAFSSGTSSTDLDITEEPFITEEPIIGGFDPEPQPAFNPELFEDDTTPSAPPFEEMVPNDIVYPDMPNDVIYPDVPGFDD